MLLTAVPQYLSTGQFMQLGYLSKYVIIQEIYTVNNADINNTNPIQRREQVITAPLQLSFDINPTPTAIIKNTIDNIISILVLSIIHFI